MHLKRIIVGIALFLCFIATLTPAQMLIEEGKIKEQVSPGETVIGSVTVHNSSKDPLDLLIYLEDFKYTAPYDGTKEFFPVGTSERSSASWITFQPKQLTLPPLGHAKVTYSVRVPQDVQGGYYSVLFFEKADRQMLTQGKAGVSVITRVGSLLFFETPDAVKTVALENIQFADDKFTATEINSGSTALVAKCLFYVLDSQSVPVDRGALDAYYLWPGSRADLQIPFAKNLNPGHYTLVITFDLEDGVSSVHEIDFSKNADGKFDLIDYRK